MFVVQNGEEIGFDMAWYAGAFMPFFTKWTISYTAWLEKINRTQLITAEKNAARKAIEPLLSLMILMLRALPKVSKAQLKALEIATGEGRGNRRNPDPTTHPDISIDYSILAWLIIHFWDQNATSKAKPHGVHGVEFKWVMQDERPAKAEDMPDSLVSTSSPLTLKFTDDDRGKRIWFCLRWESTTGGKGPWTEIMSAIIP
jgi:hypothetical protein